MPSVSAARDVLRVAAVKIRLPRLVCVDVLRGLVMVVMALDHTRDFFSGFPYPPEDLTHTTGPLFFTRFVTHFCAPTFFLLAGMGGSLSIAQGRSVQEVSKFFWTRGLWLVFLNLTLLGIAWTFVFPFWFGGVMWAIGWSMMFMALVVRLPAPWVGAIGTVIIISQNLLEKIKPAPFSNFAKLWVVLYGHGEFVLNAQYDMFFVLFSIMPWAGVMALGYALGFVMRRSDWTKIVFRIGAALTMCFFILRIFRLYGNGYAPPGWSSGMVGPWEIQPTVTLTIISFFDTSKYPASLQFLLMTLGPTLMVLAGLGRVNAERGPGKILMLFGRVPLFYYVLHLYLIHFLAVGVAVALHQPSTWLMQGAVMIQATPQNYGHGLVFVYGMWVIVVALLYLPCRWFLQFKRNHAGQWWIRYV
jgi:uncharacterized membrane protein